MPRLTVHKDGIIRSGHLDYQVFADGLIRYSGELKIKIGWFSKSFSFSGDYHVNPAIVLTETYRQRGERRVIEGIEYMAIGPGHVSLYDPINDVRGQLWLDTAQELLTIQKLQAKANKFGMRIFLRASAI